MTFPNLRAKIWKSENSWQQGVPDRWSSLGQPYAHICISDYYNVMTIKLLSLIWNIPVITGRIGYYRPP